MRGSRVTLAISLGFFLAFLALAGLPIHLFPGPPRRPGSWFGVFGMAFFLATICRTRSEVMPCSLPMAAHVMPVLRCAAIAWLRSDRSTEILETS